MEGNFFQGDNALFRKHGKIIPAESGWLYCYLLSFADNKTKECKRRVSDIASDLDLSRTTVRKHLDYLLQYGLLEEVSASKQGHTATYRVILARDVPVGNKPTKTMKPRTRDVHNLDISKAQNLDISQKRKAQNLDIESTESGHSPYIQDSVQDSDTSASIAIGPSDIEAEAIRLYTGWNLFAYHRREPTGQTKQAYIDALEGYLRRGIAVTSDHLHRAVNEAIRTWNEKGLKGIPKSPEPVLNALAEIINPMPQQENQNGTSTNGHGRGAGNGHSARPRNGRGPVDYEAQSIAEQRRKDQWVIQKYGVSRANDIDVREAVAREAAWEARERSASGAVPGATV